MENDDLMRAYLGGRLRIACCVSAMRLGKQMQFFAARVNLVKALLYAINGGRDEISGEQIAPAHAAGDGRCAWTMTRSWRGSTNTMEWLARTYVHAMNCIHYMHDKYFTSASRWPCTMAWGHLADHGFGIAGLSVVADNLPRSNTRKRACDP